MLVASTVPAVRLVARVGAVDSFMVRAQAWPIAKVVLRIAPDEALVLHVTPSDVVLPDDPHAIVEAEHGFSMIAVSWAEFDRHVRPLIEWEVPTARPTLAQGLVAFIPAKLWLGDDGVRILVATPFSQTLVERMQAL